MLLAAGQSSAMDDRYQSIQRCATHRRLTLGGRAGARLSQVTTFSVVC